MVGSVDACAAASHAHVVPMLRDAAEQSKTPTVVKKRLHANREDHCGGDAED